MIPGCPDPASDAQAVATLPVISLGSREVLQAFAGEMRSKGLRWAALNCATRLLWIAWHFLRQVSGDDVLEARIVERREQRRRRLVVQMAEAARDALLERPRVVAIRQHVEIVVAFQHERIAAAEARLDKARRRADVGQDAEPMLAIAHDELHRIARIVGHRERPHFQHPDRERIVAVEAVDALHPREALAEHLQRAERQPYRNAEAGRERCNTAGVVGMLVRDEDRADRARLDAEAREAPDRVAHGEAAIDQDAGVARFDDESVAFAATTE